MKKLLALLLALALAVPAGGAAEGMSYKRLRKQYNTYNHDDLLTVYQVVSDILFETAAAKDGVKVPAGMYIVGKDIPAGDYRIEFPVIGDYVIGSFETYDSNGLIYSCKISTSGFGVDSIGKQTLFENMAVVISDVDAVFYAYTGLF